MDLKKKLFRFFSKSIPLKLPRVRGGLSAQLTEGESGAQGVSKIEML